MTQNICKCTAAFLALTIWISLSAFSEELVANGGSPEEPVKLFPIVKGGKWGFADQSGKVVIEPKYDGAWDFSEGLAAVGVGLKRGFIDRTGALVIKPKYGWTGKFHSGRAAVFGHRDGKPIGARSKDIWGDDIQMYKPAAGYIYIDKTGKVYSGGGTSPMDFKDGLACKRNSVIDTNGKSIKHDAKMVGKFSEGMLPAMKGGKWGYMDRDMKWVIEPQYDAALEFSEGKAAIGREEPTGKVWMRRGKKILWGFIDKTGKMLTKYEFIDVDRFSNDMAAVRPVSEETGGMEAEGAGELWGYIDQLGILKIKPQFTYAWRFSEEMGRVLHKEKQGFINKRGRFAIQPTFDTAWEFNKGLARVGVGEKEGYINLSGKFIWEPTE